MVEVAQQLAIDVCLYLHHAEPFSTLEGLCQTTATRISLRLSQRPLHPCSACYASVQEESSLCILYHPLKPLLQILPGHGAAAQDVPFVCSDGVEPKSLRAVNIIGLATRPNQRQHPPREPRPRSWHQEHRSCS